MKILDIQQYEKLKIKSVNASDLKMYNKFNNTYKFFPKDKYELRDIIIERIRTTHRYDCDFNDIDVSKITDFSKLFKCKPLTKFNGDISKWDVSNAEQMQCMFYDLYYFDCNLNDWDVSNVVNMTNMFSGCTVFNSPINDWDVSNVMDMEAMFAACYEFDQPLDKWYDKLGHVKNMSRMFYNCHKFDQDLSSWEISTSNTHTINMFADKTDYDRYGHYNVISEKHKPRLII